MAEQAPPQPPQPPQVATASLTFPTSEEFRGQHPVKLKRITIREFDRLCSNRTKVYVMGRYKTGKSTIVGKLVGKELGHAVHNTRGVDIFVAPSSIYFDTEGLSQPLATADPFFTRDVVVQQMSEIADVVVFVVGQIDMSDCSLLAELEQLYAATPRIKRLIVVHNLKGSSTVEELEAYRTGVEKSLQLTRNAADGYSSYRSVGETKRIVEHRYIQQGFTERCMGQIQHMISLINSNSSETEFSKSVNTSIQRVLNKFYECKEPIQPGQWQDRPAPQPEDQQAENKSEDLLPLLCARQRQQQDNNVDDEDAVGSELRYQIDGQLAVSFANYQLDMNRIQWHWVSEMPGTITLVIASHGLCVTSLQAVSTSVLFLEGKQYHNHRQHPTIVRELIRVPLQINQHASAILEAVRESQENPELKPAHGYHYFRFKLAVDLDNTRIPAFIDVNWEEKIREHEQELVRSCEARTNNQPQQFRSRRQANNAQNTTNNNNNTTRPGEPGTS